VETHEGREERERERRERMDTSIFANRLIAALEIKYPLYRNMKMEKYKNAIFYL